MKKIIEKFYAMLFEDKEEGPQEPIPYANKVFMFYFTIIITIVVLILITLQIMNNFQQLNLPPAQ